MDMTQEFVKKNILAGCYDVISITFEPNNVIAEIPINNCLTTKYLSNYKCSIPRNLAIKKVIFNNPATIVYWLDGSRTVVKCGDDDVFDKEKGLAMAIAKRAMGGKGNYNDIFKKWCE